MGEVGVRRGSMPMFFLRWNVHDISHGDDFLVRLGGDNARASSHKEHLITGMVVHLIPMTSAEVNNADIKVVAHRWRHQRLARHGATRKQGTRRVLLWDLLGF